MLLAKSIIYCNHFDLLIFIRFSSELAYVARVRWSRFIIINIFFLHLLYLINFILISIVRSLLNRVVPLATFEQTYFRLLSNFKLLLVLILRDTRSIDIRLGAGNLMVTIFIFKVIIILTILSYFHLNIRLWASCDCFLILVSSTFILRTFWNFILGILEIIISWHAIAFFDILNRFFLLDIIWWVF